MKISCIILLSLSLAACSVQTVEERGASAEKIKFSAQLIETSKPNDFSVKLSWNLSDKREMRLERSRLEQVSSWDYRDSTPEGTFRSEELETTVLRNEAEFPTGEWSDASVQINRMYRYYLVDTNSGLKYGPADVAIPFDVEVKKRTTALSPGNWQSHFDAHRLFIYDDATLIVQPPQGYTIDKVIMGHNAAFEIEHREDIENRLCLPFQLYAGSVVGKLTIRGTQTECNYYKEKGPIDKANALKRIGPGFYVHVREGLKEPVAFEGFDPHADGAWAFACLLLGKDQPLWKGDCKKADQWFSIGD